MASRQYWVIGRLSAEGQLDRDPSDGNAVLGPFQSYQQASDAVPRGEDDEAEGAAPRYSIIASAHNPVRKHLLAVVSSMQASRPIGA